MMLFAYSGLVSCFIGLTTAGIFQDGRGEYNFSYTEHCSVGPTKLIETTTTTIASMRMTMKISKFRFLNLDF